MYLINAIYFNAAWQHPFNKDATSDGVFHLLGGADVTVPMMRETESLGYAEGNGYQAVELPYDGRELSMLILLPASGNFKAFEDALNAQQVDAILDGLEYKHVSLTLPKFEFDSSFSLKETLRL